MTKVQLTEGPITSTIVKLSLPLMATAFIQLAYNLTDTLWLGRLSAEAMASAGANHLVLWFGTALLAISRVGATVPMAHRLGAGRREEAKDYAAQGLILNTLICLLFSSLLWGFRENIIGFFRLSSPKVVEDAISYLKIMVVGMFFYFQNPVLAAMLHAEGDSVSSFRINAVGLVVNMVLDPLLIFGWGRVPSMGVKGAAVATVLAQAVVFSLYWWVGLRRGAIYTGLAGKKGLSRETVGTIFRLGTPIFLQIGFHCAVSWFLTRMVAGFGDIAVAVFAGGQQIESVAWMTAEGASSAITAFTGQNFGAGKEDRVVEGFRRSMAMMASMGLVAGLILALGAKAIMGAFFPHDPEAVLKGTVYLRIVGGAHIFSNLELGASGALNGIGCSRITAINGAVNNLLRLPMAYALIPHLGLHGIWVAIAISMVLKGIFASVAFLPALRRTQIPQPAMD